MSYTLRVTDDMITAWKASEPNAVDYRCPLSLALKAELIARGTPPAYMLNAGASRGGSICFQLENSNQWYIVYPTPQDTQPVLKFIHNVDYDLELGQPYPRRRVFHYGSAQPTKLEGPLG